MLGVGGLNIIYSKFDSVYLIRKKSIGFTLVGAGGAGAKLQTGSKGISPEMSLLVLNPGVVALLQICFAESNYCRVAGIWGNRPAFGAEGSGSWPRASGAAEAVDYLRRGLINLVQGRNGASHTSLKPCWLPSYSVIHKALLEWTPGGMQRCWNNSWE